VSLSDHNLVHWTDPEIQRGLTLREQNYLDDLAHGYLAEGVLEWVCELILRSKAGE
jgi:hypothetical protein